MASLAGAQAALPSLTSQRIVTPLSVDFTASGFDSVTWAEDSPTLTQLGLDLTAGLEYTTPISMPIRLEVGYIGFASSGISSDGEQYRAWQGARFALLTGYNFAPLSIEGLGKLKLALLAGGAVTAAEYTDTALAYAYPSIVLEPRALLALNGIFGGDDTGPYITLPTELMFRAGNYSLAPGVGLGFRYRIIGIN
jgi:hypothetical protein